MKTLYVMDPIESLHLEGDSTYMMMLEANKRGWVTSWCTPKDLFALGGRAYAKAIQVQVLEDEPFLPEGEEAVTVTISIGATEYNPKEALSTFIQRADQAMYRSKRNGRNRVSMLYADTSPEAAGKT